MISHGEGFVIRHRSGRYLCSDIRSRGFEGGQPILPLEFCWFLVGNPFAAPFIYKAEPYHRMLATPEWQDVADQFDVVPGPGCAVCGERGGIMWGEEGGYRCDKHKDRNPCAIEGCKRTRAAGNAGLASDQYLCGEHWRKYVPPRSRLRRLYHAHFRRGKREGWTMKRNRQFHRFWDFVVRVARKRHNGGFIDEAEINRIMGWG
ncbi:hypothetical protein [Sphingopyxis granuli]|uniref:hypothetical protein n=1 Tax=Sphingopyxis granuli TaxID=267128 RepID=UPI001BAED1C9|nr:hypothetical protein [Sphingopyxis granuli]QUM72168.1 hypothetical protein ICN83_18050 [Sphingopyxis granuli]